MGVGRGEGGGGCETEGRTKDSGDVEGEILFIVLDSHSYKSSKRDSNYGTVTRRR